MLDDTVRRYPRRSREGRRLLPAVAGAAGALLAGVALAVHGGASSAALRVTVHPGDTLWAIARAHYPGDDVQARVADIEARNGLVSARISPGRVLTLPAP